jgi:hypothetical protein
LLTIFDAKQRLEVPLFQRQYVWNEEQQWLPLWEDIERKFAEVLEERQNAPHHFLGAMVLDQKQTPTGHVVVRQVIDGQGGLSVCCGALCRVLAHRAQSRRCNSLVAIEGIADIGMRWSPEGSVANDHLGHAASKNCSSFPPQQFRLGQRFCRILIRA